MKTLFYLVASICLGFVFDMVFGQVAGGFVPPLMVAVICYWFWHFDLGERLLLALCAGVIMDTLGFLPAGTYALLLVALAWMCEPMKSFFSNTESRPVVVLCSLILLIGFRIMVAPAISLIRLL
ncbi:MAG: rod shape-determining protein MreD [bacterium]|nr:rod shape-determining protein MreD [bacterium]MDZ4285978.1 rod shape-determining protein MreD [Candidatus Sungbacteria bacterium]